MPDPTSNLGEHAKRGGPGRPKGSKDKVTRHRALIDEVLTEDDERAIWMSVASMAKGDDKTAPDLAAWRLILEYRYGKPTQTVELDAGSGLKEVVFKVVPVSNDSESSDGDNNDTSVHG